LFIEDIVQILNQSNVTSIKIGKADLNILLYADDMILLAYNIFDLQEKINILRRYFQDDDLQVNLDKTKVVIFRQGNVKVKNCKIFWGEDELVSVDEYIYLGVPMYGKMKYSCTADSFVSKAMQAQQDLLHLFYRAKMNNFETRLYLFDCLVKSVLF
jgi:hypothetical protein